MRLRRCAAVVAVSAGLAVPLAGTAAAADRNCSDFSTQADAQSVLDADPSDPNHLDADHDGIACENLPGGTGQEVGTTPVGGVPAGDGSTAGSGDTARYVLGGLGLTAAAGAALAARRAARTRG
jgi:hypothetical protein